MELSWILTVEYKSNGFDLRPVGLLKEAITRDLRVFASSLCFHVRISRSDREREKKISVRIFQHILSFHISANLRATSDLYRIFSSVCSLSPFYFSHQFFFYHDIIFLQTVYNSYLSLYFQCSQKQGYWSVILLFTSHRNISVIAAIFSQALIQTVHSSGSQGLKQD